MIKAVLDVGQFISATIRVDGHPAQILEAWHNGEFELFTSLPILEDLRRVLGYPRIRKKHLWTDDEIDFFVVSLAVATRLTPGELDVRAVINDPTDDKILVCAEEGRVNYIVASDEHLLSLHAHQGIPIVSPRQFLMILEENKK